jgi:hypothetical protein
MDRRRIDLIGQVFGRLTVKSLVRVTPSGCIWRCLCACGNNRNVRTSHLRAGEQISCGCARLERMRAYGKASRVYVVDGRRTCSKCKESLPVSEFNKSRATLSGYQTHCRKCGLAYERERHYGVTREQTAALLAAQDGHCAVCPETRSLHIDHNHETGKVRGLLCGNHNRALGLLQDDKLTIARLFQYIERANEGQKMSA